eukprot:s1083_g5.t1
MLRHAACRQGSDGFVTDEELKQCWMHHATCMVHGKPGDGQMAGDEREKAWHGPAGTRRCPGLTPPVILCAKGNTGVVQNQDNFSLCFLADGWTLACCSDGHGFHGQLVATRVVTTVPHFIAHKFADGLEEHGVPAALTAAFDSAQKDLEAHSARFGWDCEASGASLIAALYKGSKVYTAHCGDARLASIGLRRIACPLYAQVTACSPGIQHRELDPFNARQGHSNCSVRIPARVCTCHFWQLQASWTSPCWPRGQKLFGVGQRSLFEGGETRGHGPFIFVGVVVNLFATAANGHYIAALLQETLRLVWLGQ